MNLPMIFSNIGRIARKVGGNALLFGRAHAPELMIGAGVAGFGVTIYETVKATNKTNDILDNREQRIARFEKVYMDNPEDPNYTRADLEMDVKTVERQAKGAIVKAWLPTATTGVASVILVLGGYRILNGRYVATAAAYKALESSFERYRENVISKFGKDTDWEMLNTLKAEEVEAERKERLAVQNSDKKSMKARTAYNRSIHSQIFDQYSDRWRDYWTPDQVWEYLKIVEDQMNDKLKIQKHLFVNEVWDRLGLPRTPEGQVSGWIITRNNPDSHVSFGLDDIPESVRRDFLRETFNENIQIRLRLNPDGMIYNMIDESDSIINQKLDRQRKLNRKMERLP